MWFFIIFLIIVGGLITLYTVEAWIELDRWIADAPKREANGYMEDVKKPTPPQPKPVEPVKKLTPKLDNFPQNPQEAKARIEKLLAEAKKSA